MKLLFRYLAIKLLGKSIDSLSKVGHFKEAGALIEKIVYEIISLTGQSSNKQSLMISQLNLKVSSLSEQKLKLEGKVAANKVQLENQAKLIEQLRRDLAQSQEDYRVCDSMFGEFADNTTKIISDLTKINPVEGQSRDLVLSIQQGKGIPSTWYDDNTVVEIIE